ncbi:MAG: transposase [Deltaproteobacteria bacterium]|nr:transposase [Deltaproteobacteria bacterium]
MTSGRHADAYSGYDELFERDGVIEACLPRRVGCWVHVRRKFLACCKQG